MEEAVEVIETSLEDKSLCDLIIDLPDESESIISIDMSKVDDVCKEIARATTTKRLSVIEDVESKIKTAFLSIERYQEFTESEKNLKIIFKQMKTDIEFDYFMSMLGGSINE